MHQDDENLMQLIYQIIIFCFEDDYADELTNDSVFKAIIDKDSLASQPTFFRFFNRMDEVFDKYMKDVFGASQKYVIIYSCNFEKDHAKHVRCRNFTDWIDTNLTG